jgi:tetraprenyl-beta-curcumene synthase
MSGVLAAKRRDGARRAHRRDGGPLRALAMANARYWPTVLPAVSRELARWQQPAGAIEDPTLRRLALHKLGRERFNAEVAATLATLTPRRERDTVVAGMVALQVLFDYLDGRTEGLASDPVECALALFAPFTAAVRPGGAGHRHENAAQADTGKEDRAYLNALSATVAGALEKLPSSDSVAGCAQAAAERCALAQSRIHAVASLGHGQLEGWACEHGAGSQLGWREYAAGGASSVLALHAMIAAAAQPQTSEQDAQRLDDAYLAIGAVITLLDSLVDEVDDAARGEDGFIALYEPGELAERLPALTRQALARAQQAPAGAYHAMTLAGVIAYYTTHPGARQPAARAIAAEVRRVLSPTIWPTLATMRAWRAAKAARVRFCTATSADQDT